MVLKGTVLRFFGLKKCLTVVHFGLTSRQGLFCLLSLTRVNMGKEL